MEQLLVVADLLALKPVKTYLALATHSLARFVSATKLIPVVKVVLVSLAYVPLALRAHILAVLSPQQPAEVAKIKLLRQIPFASLTLFPVDIP